jgi:hypothetical protein
MQGCRIEKYGVYWLLQAAAKPREKIHFVKTEVKFTGEAP